MRRLLVLSVLDWDNESDRYYITHEIGVNRWVFMLMLTV